MSADPAAAVAVRMTGIHKRFGAVRANEAVNLSVAAGSVIEARRSAALMRLRNSRIENGLVM